MYQEDSFTAFLPFMGLRGMLGRFYQQDRDNAALKPVPTQLHTYVPHDKKSSNSAQ